MKKTMFTSVVVAMCVIVFASCAIVQEPSRSADAKSNVAAGPPNDAEAVMWLKVTRDGTIVAQSVEGHELKPCSFATPGGQDDENVCKGFRKGYHMLSVDTVTIFRADGSPDCYIYYDAQGNPHEVCW